MIIFRTYILVPYFNTFVTVTDLTRYASAYFWILNFYFFSISGIILVFVSGFNSRFKLIREKQRKKKILSNMLLHLEELLICQEKKEVRYSTKIRQEKKNNLYRHKEKKKEICLLYPHLPEEREKKKTICVLTPHFTGFWLFYLSFSDFDSFPSPNLW